MNGERSPSRRILETAKTLVTAYGQSEAARQLNIPLGTICAWAHRYHWKRVVLTQPSPQPFPPDIPAAAQNKTTKASPSKAQEVCKTPSEAIEQSLKSHRTRSTIALAQWTAEASEEAVQAPQKLAIAKRVRDVANVHSILWPAETVRTIIDFDILTGAKAVLPIENVNTESTPSPLALAAPREQEQEQRPVKPTLQQDEDGHTPAPDRGTPLAP
jgi:hypothetical protein